MATPLRNTEPTMAAFASAVNQVKDSVVAQTRLVMADLASATGAGTSAPSLGFHNDKSEVTIGSADATDLPTSLKLCNEILDVYQFHMADTLAHKVAGVALASYAHVALLADAITRANDIKAKYNTHRASTTYHYVADSTDSTTSADATDQGSLNTLLTELKADINAHMASGPAAKSVRLVDA